ncbi:hypothetical protein ACOMHN_035439 [Nucella lapillus]
MVRPVLEYSSTVWDPYTAEEINQLESVQKAAARYVVGDYRRTTSITALLNRLKWPSLQKRRTAARLTMLYKIRHKKASVNTTRLRKPRDRPRRGHDQQYERIVYGKKRDTEQDSMAFLPRTTKLWNTLSQETVQAPSASAFTRRVLSEISN